MRRYLVCGKRRNTPWVAMEVCEACRKRRKCFQFKEACNEAKTGDPGGDLGN